MTEDIKQDIPSLDYNDNKVLDALVLTKEEYRTSTLKTIFFTAIALFVFFVPVTIKGETNVMFGVIYGTIKSSLGLFGLWLVCLVIVLNGLLSVYGIYICKNKDNPIAKFFEGDTKIYPLIYLLGSVFALVFVLDYTFPSFVGPVWMIGPETGGSVIPTIVTDVAWIIPVGCFFMPFLLNYGCIDFFGALLEPFMRVIFKVPGRSAVNALASFVSSSSVGVLITSKMYRDNIYTEKEADLIATGFSAVSVGFAYMVIKTAGLQDHFLKVYFISMFITLFINIFMARIPPLSWKKSVYPNGRVQTPEDIKSTTKINANILKIGLNRAVKKSYVAKELKSELVASLKDGFFVLPKVISLLTAVGTLGLITAVYTPFLDWIGLLFIPLLNILQVPDAAAIAPSFPVGLAEMFLPVLLIADQIDTISIGARYVVTTVSIVQVIFFSETVVVMLATKIPISLPELIVCFFERTIIAIPIAALFMHILF